MFLTFFSLPGTTSITGPGLDPLVRRVEASCLIRVAVEAPLAIALYLYIHEKGHIALVTEEREVQHRLHTTKCPC